MDCLNITATSWKIYLIVSELSEYNSDSMKKLYLIVKELSEIEMARKDGANLNRLLEGRSESSEFG